MTGCRVGRVVAVLAVLSLMGCAVSAAPSVTITSPEEGAVVLTDLVNVTGTAGGSNARWNQSAPWGGLAGGTFSSTELDGTGSVVLERRFSEDFNDNTIDLSKWDLTEVGGVHAVERNGQLNISGTVENLGQTYREYARLESRTKVGTMVAATLDSFKGTGSGYRTHIFFLQDVSNYVQVGRIYDAAAYGKEVIEWGYTSSGSGNSGSLGTPTPGPHEYKITYVGGKVRVFEDDVQIASTNIALTNPDVYLIAAGKTRGDTVEAIWDDLYFDYLPSGMYTSTVHDTGASSTSLRYVDFNGTFPGATGVALQVRSSPNPNMSSPTMWTSVYKGQTAGLPQLSRYVQYRALLTSPDGLETPSLVNVTLVYNKGIDHVEVRVEGASAWTPAVGTLEWYASLELPENATTIWVRAVDVVGDTYLTRVNVTVDTTPPVGRILINEGATTTADRNVTLGLNASDAYGISSMMVSEDPSFTAMDWGPFRTEMPWRLSYGDGEKTVYARFRDAHGLVSATVSDSITLDTTAPTGTLTIDEGATYTVSRDVTLALNATDMLGVVSMRVWEGEAVASATWEPYSRTGAFRISGGDGTKTLHAEFRDPLDHVSVAATDTIILDTTPPVVSMRINGGADITNRTEVSVVIDVVDANPPEQVELLSDSGALLLRSAGVAFTHFLSQGDGLKLLHAGATDLAGIMAVLVPASILLDTTPPVITITLDGGASHTATRDVEVALNVTDASSPTEMIVREGTVLEGVDAVPYASTSTVTVSSGDGIKTISAKARDRAGNWGEAVTATIVLDSTPPASSVNAQHNDSEALDILLKWTAADAASGVARYDVQYRIGDGWWVDLLNGTTETQMVFTGKAGNTYYFRARATDVTGNVEPFPDDPQAFAKVTIKEPPPRFLETPLTLAIVVVLVIAAAVGVGYYLYKRKEMRGGPGTGP